MIFKYITLLMFSGVVIPVYMDTCTLKDNLCGKHTKPAIVNTVAQHKNAASHFSFIDDVAAKLLPAVNFFK